MLRTNSQVVGIGTQTNNYVIFNANLGLAKMHVGLCLV